MVYAEPQLNDKTDVLYLELDRIRQVVAQCDGPDPDATLVGTIVVAFSALVGWSHDSGLSLVDFLHLIEREVNLIIAEQKQNLQHENQSKRKDH